MITKRDDESRGPTREELLALPAAVDLETANRALSLSRTTEYQLAEQGRYPCTVLRLGNAYQVVTADLLQLLHIDVAEAAEAAEAEEAAAATLEVKTASGVSPACCCCRCCCAHRCGRSVVISTKRVGMVPSRGLLLSVRRVTQGWGAQGERGCLWTVQHGIPTAVS